MTKPWDETWFTSMKGSGVLLSREGECGDEIPLIARSIEQASGDMQLARLELAAAAPEMARALLTVEKAMAAEMDFFWCCNAHAPTHASTCPLDAALRKAGVR